MAKSNETSVWKSEIKEEDSKGNSYLEVSLSENPLFIFVFHRYKVLDTKEEFLSIKVYQYKEDGTVDKTYSCAEIERVSVPDLQIKLQRDMPRYGVILHSTDFIKIYREVIKHYLSMDAIALKTDGITVTNTVIADLYQMLIDYVYNDNVPLSDHKSYKSYDIPVPDFKRLIEDSLFCKYNYVDLRLKLSKHTVEGKNAFRCSYGRTDNTIKEEKSSKKVISLIAEVAQPFLDELSENN